MFVLLPTSASRPVDVVGETADGTDASIRIGRSDDVRGLVIRTIERTGERMTAEGFAHGVADWLPAVAALAVKELLMERLRPQSTKDQLRVSLDSASNEADRIGRRVFDTTVWTTTRMLVDGEGYALHVHRLGNRFAAVADLGPYVITMRGGELPADLTFSLRPLEDLPRAG